MSKPTVLSAVLCQALYRCDATGHANLLGVFGGGLITRSLPVQRHIVLYCQITDIHDPFSITSEIVNMNTGGIVMEYNNDAAIEHAAPRHPELITEINHGIKTTFTEKGVHAVRIYLNENDEEPWFERRFALVAP